jgi:hypothetical protein
MPLSQVNRNRIKNIIILLLIVALTVLLIISLPLIRNKGNVRTQYIQQLRRECQEAYNNTQTLSRTAGADSAEILASVRSNIHAMRVVNNLSGAGGNGYLVDDGRLSSLISTVEEYLGILTTGMETGQYVTSLSTSLADLQAAISNLE